MASYRALAVIVLAAGKGTRMKSAFPKALQRVAGKTLISHVVDELAKLSPQQIIVVTAPDQQDVRDAVSHCDHAIQTKQLGTAHAVTAAMDKVAPGIDTIMIQYTDGPVTPVERFEEMLAARTGGAALVTLGFETTDPRLYGRIIASPDGNIDRIVEARDATPEELAVRLCATAIFACDRDRLATWLPQIRNENVKGEYYLTDIVAIARDAGESCRVVPIPEDEFVGVDDRIGQARAESLIQARLRRTALENGVCMISPDTVTMSADTVFGRDVIIHPNVVFGPGVTIGDNVEIKSFSHLEGTSIQAGASVGPYARLRPGAEIGENARVGNFVEIKNATLGHGAKASHLTYLGDAEVGADANIGAGTITCNYDGYNKDITRIGKGAFIGSNTALVAPITIGDGAMVGAGSTINSDIRNNDIAVTRAPQKNVPDGAERFRKKAAARKAAKTTK